MKTTQHQGVAIALSFFFTGLGQLYAGNVARGLTMMFTTVFLVIPNLSDMIDELIHATPTPAIIFTNSLFCLLSIAYWIYGMIDAKHLCKQYNEEQPQ